MIPAAKLDRESAVAGEREGTRLQSGGTLFAKLMQQLEKSFETLGSLRNAADQDRALTARGSVAPAPGSDRARAAASGDDLGRNCVTDSIEMRAAADVVDRSPNLRAESSSGKWVGVNDLPSGKPDRGDSSISPADHPASASQSAIADAMLSEVARPVGVSQSALAAPSFATSETALQGDAGVARDGADGTPGALAARSVPRPPVEAAGRPVVSSATVPGQGAHIAIGLPRTNSQEVEELRSRIAEVMARAGLTNYRLTINGAAMKRTSPAGGQHGDR